MHCGNFESRLLNGDYGHSLICVNTRASQVQVYSVSAESWVCKSFKN